MASSNEKTLIDELQTSITLLGVKATTSILRAGINSISQNKDRSTILQFFYKVCEVFNLDIGFIQSESKIFDDEKKVAISFCFYFLKEILNMKYQTIQEALKTNYSTQWCCNLNSIIRDAKKDNPKNPIDKLIASHYKELKEFSESLK